MADNTNNAGQSREYVYLVRGNGSMIKMTADSAQRLLRQSPNYRLASDAEVAAKQQSTENDKKAIEEREGKASASSTKKASRKETEDK